MSNPGEKSCASDSSDLPLALVTLEAWQDYALEKDAMLSEIIAILGAQALNDPDYQFALGERHIIEQQILAHQIDADTSGPLG